MTPPKKLRDTSGNAVFQDGSQGNRLALLLAGAVDSNSVDEMREEAATAARAQVDALPQWGEQTAQAHALIALSAEFAGQIAYNLERLFPEAFNSWRAAAKETLASHLVDGTEKFLALNNSARAAFPGKAVPFPVTTPDIAALSARLAILDTSSPTEAKALIADGIQRGDKPYLAAAASNLRSWREYRASWSKGDAKAIADDLLSQIDVATWTADDAAATYAQGKADEYLRAWRNLVSRLPEGVQLDPVYRDLGAFSPLLDPVKAKGSMSPTRSGFAFTFGPNGEMISNQPDDVND